MKSSATSQGKVLITAEEAASLLGVKKQSVYQWVRQGLIPCYRVGKRLIKFDPEELLAAFKIEPVKDGQRPAKVNLHSRPLTEPFRSLEKTETPESKDRGKRYRALLGVVK